MTVEFLHSQTPCGMPLHKLQLKVGCPIMLLRNLDIKKGLCNGTRLKVLRLGDRCIEAEIVSGSAAQLGRSVFIPRIKLSPSDSAHPPNFIRAPPTCFAPPQYLLAPPQHFCSLSPKL